MKKIVLCSVFFVLSYIAKAQKNTTLNGIVKNQTTGKVIPNVSVKILNTTKGTITNEEGFYNLLVPQKTSTIQFSCMGYYSHTTKIKSTSKNKELNIFLKENKTILDEISINSSLKNNQVLAIGKLPVKSIDAPITTNNVSSDLLQKRNTSDLGDAVKSVTGVRPINRYGGFQTFRIRGFNNFVLLVDGTRDERHNLSTSAPSTNLANIERIEVLKGPASVLYGHSALGGIINLVRKQPTKKQTGDFNITYGSFNTYNITAGISSAITDNLNYRMDFGSTETDGFRDYGVATKNGSFVLDYAPSKNDKLSLYVQVNNDLYDTDTGIPVDENSEIVSGVDPETRYNDPQDFLKHKRYDYQLKYTHKFSEKLNLNNHLSYSDDDINYLSTELLEVNETNNTIKRAFPFYFNHTTKSIQNQVELDYTTNTGNIEHKLLIGNSFSYLNRKTFRGSVIGPGAFTSVTIKNPILNQGHISTVDEKVDVKKEFVSGFYFQNWLSFSEKIKALIGVRYDIFEGKYHRDIIDNNRNVITPGEQSNIPSTALTYRGGLLYQPIKNTLSFFASYSNYFKPTRRIGVDGQQFNPEEGYQIESGIKFNQKQNVSLTLSAFYMLKENIVERTNVDDYQQIGEADSKGIELDIEIKPFSGFYIKAGYAYVDAKIKDYNESLQSIKAGNSLRFSPKNSANLWANYEFHHQKLNGLGLGIGANYVGENYTDSSNTYILPEYYTIDSAIYYKVNKLRFGINLNNITNKLYFTDAIYGNQFFVGQKRNFKISIGYSL